MVVLLCQADCKGTDGHDHGPHTADHHHHLHHGDDEPHPQHEGQHSNTLSKPNTDFAFALYKKLSAIPEFQEKNIFFSPLSISMALSMLALGAKGETFSQLYEALGYAEMPTESVNEACQLIIDMLGVTQKYMQIDISNALVVTERAQITDTFLEDTKKYHSSEAFSVDFSKPDEVVQEINNYIAQKTNNKITDMINEVDPKTLVILINCIYFWGEWFCQFYERLTEKDDFHVDDQNKVTVDMMLDVNYYDFYEDKENFVTVVRLPYEGSADMIVVLPDQGKMKEVEGSISQTLFRQWEQSLANSYLHLYMPKFSIVGTYSLEETLQEMGMVNVFSCSADLSGMTEEEVVLSQVKHKAILSVDEKGTEAAASTVGLMCGSSGCEPEEVIVKVNRPFLVFITESKTKSMLFMGKISNPTSQ
ncbi:hypothetical protein ACEWY4_014711 [Coilia grayii]|uniref:Serpin domain-containing protein n=1 Tax=Coilia grayii TaxID=363190 RepID=A0ABD1JT07_9TELE